MDCLIRAENLVKVFEQAVVPSVLLQDRLLHAHRHRRVQRIRALDGVSLTLRRGEWLGITGPNGGGKTTLLRILAGLLPPDGGSIRVDGTFSCFFTLGVGFHDERSAAENLLLHGLFQGMSGKEIARRTDAVIRLAGVESHRDLPLKCYSTGMRMRLGFAAAMQVPSDVYLLDEILAVGDAAFQATCHDELGRKRSAGLGAVLVNHDVGLLRRFCDRILYIEAGRIQREEIPSASAAATISVSSAAQALA